MKRARPQAAQLHDMAVAAEPLAEIARNAAHIAALAADHLQHGMVFVRSLDQRQALDPDRPGFEFRRRALSRQIIGARTADLDGGEDGRALPQRTVKR
mgnify:CR=1 FL=1